MTKTLEVHLLLEDSHHHLSSLILLFPNSIQASTILFLWQQLQEVLPIFLRRNYPDTEENPPDLKRSSFANTAIDISPNLTIF
jgi:hypothetical protein